MSNRETIVFEPCRDSSNRYVNIFCSILKRNKIDVVSLGDFFKSIKLMRRVQIVHLNWFENLFGKKSYELYLSFCKTYTKLLILRWLKKDVIWTMHNRIPHDQRLIGLKMFLLKEIVRDSKAIVVHSRLSERILLENFKVSKEKILYIPHPNYVNEYGPIEIASSSNDDDGILKLLFLGAAKPYKNIELLIDVVKEIGNRIELTIAGKPLNQEYKQKLTEYGQGFPNIKLDLRFIPDKEVANFIAKSDLVVLPYHILSSLNSGSAILAFSYRRSVICPEIGTIKDLVDKKSVYSYTYISEKDHMEKLKVAILDAFADKKQGTLEMKGDALFDFVSKEYSHVNVEKSLLGLYKKFFIR